MQLLQYSKRHKKEAHTLLYYDLCDIKKLFYSWRCTMNYVNDAINHIIILLMAKEKI